MNDSGETTRPGGHCGTLNIRVRRADAHVEAEDTGWKWKVQRATHASGSLPRAADCCSLRKCLKREAEARRSAELNVRQRASCVSFLALPHWLAAKGKSLQYFSAKKDGNAGASSQPSTTQPRSWTLSSEQPLTSWMGQNNLLCGGSSRWPLQAQDIKSSPNVVSAEIMQRRARSLAELCVRLFLGKRITEKILKCHVGWKTQHSAFLGLQRGVQAGHSAEIPDEGVSE